MKLPRQTTMAQVRHMRASCPKSRVRHRDKHQAAFECELRPFQKTYTVLILFRMAPPGPGLPNPAVMVLDPRLRGRKERPDEAIPHVYGNPWNPLLPFLCLFHPPSDRFDPRHHRLADTVVPWTIDWLACYEIWLATGKWVGGGVSH